MSTELEKLKEAFRGEKGITPRASAKQDAISAAMFAFEEEKTSNANQGIDAATRLNGQGVQEKPLSKWRRMMNSINTKWTYGLMGGASVAVLAMIVVGPNVSELLQIPESDRFARFAEPAETLPEAVKPTPQVRPVPQAEAVIAAGKGQQTNNQRPAPTAKPQLRSQLQAQGDTSFGATPTAKQLNEMSIDLSQAPVVGQPLYIPKVGDVVVPQYRDQGRDRFEAIKTNPVKVTSEEPVSTFSVDVDTASYAFMRSSINNGVLPPKNAIRVEELINYFDYDYEVPADASEPFKANVSIMPTPWNAGTKLMSIGIKGYELQRDEAPAANLVFLIDTSGSMNAHDKLPLLINSFKLLLSNLKPDDTVSIVTYAGGAGTVLEPTKAADKAKIMDSLEKLYAGGSTSGAEGIRQAYKLAEANFREDGVNRVILATDGDFNVGISDPEALKSYIERKRDTGVTLSVLGFGRGNYNDELMQKLAQNGNGNAAYIDTLSEARKVLVEEAGSTLFTIAKDVKLQVEFNPAQVSEYRLIGYETRALAREDFNNDKVDAGDIGAGHTVTALYEITPVGSASGLVDDLRYRASNRGASSALQNEEYGFLKIRYKLPESDTSSLITRPIGVKNEVSSTTAATRDARFAASVAAFGQVLRGGQYTGTFSHDDIIALAQSGKGDDEFGYRAEFINLVRLAKTAAELEPLKQ